MECCTGDCEVQAGEKLQAGFKSRCSSEKVRKEAGMEIRVESRTEAGAGSSLPFKAEPTTIFF